MIGSIADTILGTAEIPKKAVNGKIHTMDGKPVRPVKPPSPYANTIKARHKAICEICRFAPTTAAELREVMDVKEGTLNDDLKKLVETKVLRSRMHKNETLYWVPL